MSEPLPVNNIDHLITVHPDNTGPPQKSNNFYNISKAQELPKERGKEPNVGFLFKLRSSKSNWMTRVTRVKNCERF